LAVIPAAVATYGPSAALSGPKLLFITLQDVFAAMGKVGPLFGVIFYLLVLIAAISSAISLIEVITTYFMDRAEVKGKQGNRSHIVLGVCLAILVEASIVALDGLGANGLWVPLQNQFGIIGEINDCWLDFMDFLSEGLAMPLGALLMSIMVGWEIKPKTLLDELHIGSNARIDTFFSICMKVIVPIGMALILLGQIDGFLHLGIF
ncbi:MAG: sodium-dependent transporter, partial [Firmicutes bacterium]|nr:sodium-dependent transporter [Bacillota bacterium]